MEKRRYRSFNSYLGELFPGRVQRVPIDAGLGCPHRDGLLKGGCIYCDPYGSGTGRSFKGVPISVQMEEGIRWAKKRYKAEYFIAYFQSYTNTYGDVDRLRSLIEEAISFPKVVGLFISTRPDCISDEVLRLIVSYKKDLLVWIELGLQSIHERTLKLINRGHGLKEFEIGFSMVRSAGIPVCTHVIFGLPYETEEEILETISFLAQIRTDGIKIHNLYVIEGTRLWDLLTRGAFSLMEQDQYVDLVVKALEILPPDTVIMRLTGDPPPNRNSEPRWALNKFWTLSKIEQRLISLDTWQGRLWKESHELRSQ